MNKTRRVPYEEDATQLKAIETGFIILKYQAMKEISFTFLGRTYRGFLAVSTEKFPQYYWCFIEDPELREELGDCLSFKMGENGALETTEPYPKDQARLIKTIREGIEKSRAARELVN